MSLTLPATPQYDSFKNPRNGNVCQTEQYRGRVGRIVSVIPEHYRGREQAFIKHTLLKGYIEKLFMIIGQNEKSISYVDCFAGPWLEGSSNLDDTSVGVSLNIISNCRKALAGLSKDVHFRALFIEKNPESYRKLKSFVERSQWSGIDVKAINGDFYDLRGEILKWCDDDSFVFFFVDPSGWKEVVEIDTLRPLLQRSKSEYLINFMFGFINRFYTQAALEQDMKQIFGSVEDLSEMSPEEREEHLISLYQERLKGSLPPHQLRPRSARVQVLCPQKDRTLYYLVYLTRHPLGIMKFMEESERLDVIQRIVREEAKQDRRVRETGQTELWSAASFQPVECDRPDPSRVKEYWLSRLECQPKRFGVDELADMLEETGWFISDFQSAFKKLQEENKAKNLDACRTRRVKVVNFEKGEHLQKLEP
jgi:three-Cys-motif partner protein